MLNQLYLSVMEYQTYKHNREINFMIINFMIMRLPSQLIL
jgi:hypothetical protein